MRVVKVSHRLLTRMEKILISLVPMAIQTRQGRDCSLLVYILAWTTPLPRNPAMSLLLLPSYTMRVLQRGRCTRETCRNTFMVGWNMEYIS